MKLKNKVLIGSQKQKTGRRQFLQKALGITACSAVFPSVIPSLVLGKEGSTAPNDRITLGFIGTGLRARAHMKNFLSLNEAQIIAVSDTFESRRNWIKQAIETHYAKIKNKGHYKGCDTYNDFRDLLVRKDIDAVVISSPQHWHGLHMKMSAEAGKDIYGEKALTRTIAEGRAVCDTVRRYGTVFQVGTQQRSSRNFRFACELVRNGYIGRLHTITVAVPGL